MATQAPTLLDVAIRAGVSTATVSRCLNMPDQVSKKTREKVAAAVAELGYSPNFAARAMAAKRTNTIGAIIPTMENAIFARGLQAFQEELGDSGYTLLVASSSYRADLEDQQIRSLVSRGADGLLLIGHARDASIYDFLEAQSVPSLVTWAFDELAEKPSVGFDNFAAMTQMVQEVLRLGHRRIGYITAQTATNDRAAARLQAVEGAMQKAGLSADNLAVVETDYAIDAGAQAFATLMEQHTQSVVMCGNDVLAVGAIQRAREMGLDVPNDVSITGFDDIELGQIAHPALCTVHVPHRDMGRIAAQHLIAMVRGEEPGSSVQLQTNLALRASLGPPRIKSSHL